MTDKYLRVVFLDGADYCEMMTEIDEEWTDEDDFPTWMDKAVAYLAAWRNGDECEDATDDPGDEDMLFYSPSYRLNYNLRRGYAGLAVKEGAQ